MLRTQPSRLSEQGPIRVLYLDDEEPNLFSFKAAFRRDFEIYTATEPNEAVRILDEQDIHVILSDQRMPGISGVEFFELIMPDHPDCTRILVTGYADTNAVVDAINKGQVYRFVSKPWNEEELRNVVISAHLQHKSRISTNRNAAHMVGALRAVDQGIRDLAENLRLPESDPEAMSREDLSGALLSLRDRLEGSTPLSLSPSESQD
jgi:response regulator RpfG family c-di-GMP phosphodiesterase